MRIVLRAIVLGLTCLAADLPTEAQGTRGMTKRDGPPEPKTELKYRKKWAVVVGINYDPTERKALPNRGQIDRLDKAETDAREFYDLLLSCYGYHKDEVVLLIGKQATKEAIEGQLQNGFLCDPNRVHPEDSVLFYYSGHGYLRREKSGERASGYLLPFDVRKTEGGEPDFATAIDTSTDLVKNLRVNCPARHKLLILDCCHAGSVFRIDERDGTEGGRSPDETIDPDLFKKAAYQAVAASREGQVASDGSSSESHSPFTKALLRSLSTIPQKSSSDRSSFTVSELFHEMQVMLHGAPEKQSSQCWWLDGNRGEFHFFPVPSALFPKVELTVAQKKLLLAIVPTTFGNWWGDEFPWFMPSLRYEILEKLPKSKSSDVYLDVRQLRQVAEQLARDARNRSDSDYRYEHLASLLASERTTGRVKVFDEIIAQLEQRVGQKVVSNDPLDLHYLGVLLQKRGRRDEARKRYEEAIKAYEAGVKGRESLLPLLALCHVDYGVLCQTSLFEFDDAVESFEKARVTLEETPPGPFFAFIYCREADAYRRLGRFGQSDRCMYFARDLMAKFDPSQSQPLSAAIWKHDALACLEQCKFKAATIAFKKSKQILDKLIKDSVNHEQCLIDLFHIEHGLAMIERFQGRDANALAQFRADSEDRRCDSRA